MKIQKQFLTIDRHPSQYYIFLIENWMIHDGFYKCFMLAKFTLFWDQRDRENSLMDRQTQSYE